VRVILSTGLLVLILAGCYKYSSRREALNACFSNKQGGYGSGTGCVEDVETKQFIYYKNNNLAERFRY